jgi:hypothetical protein
MVNFLKTSFSEREDARRPFSGLCRVFLKHSCCQCVSVLWFILVYLEKREAQKDEKTANFGWGQEKVS